MNTNISNVNRENSYFIAAKTEGLLLKYFLHFFLPSLFYSTVKIRQR